MTALALSRPDAEIFVPDGKPQAAALEAKTAVFALQQLVLLHFDAALPDTLDAPHAAVIVQQRALLRSPRHRDNGVAASIVAVNQPARVMIGMTFKHAGGQLQLTGADQLAQPAAKLVDDGLRLCSGHSLVRQRDECLGSAHARPRN